MTGPTTTGARILPRPGRREALEAMAGEPVDLVVVGGGITGAGIARDAALRGLRVALLEKEDFGAGTSSRSSKIIHGGVRYLEHFQFGLVRESAREREVLRGIAPHLVHRIPFHYPVYGGESYLRIRVGLLLYDFLAGSRGADRSVALGPDETREALPGMRGPLRGSVRYPEFITDDARFTLENVLSAVEYGALAANHAQVRELILERGRAAGAVVEDLLEGRTYEIRGRAVVNATGPWVESFAGAQALPPGAGIVPSKGAHILLPAARLPLRAATFLRSRRGRSGLAMRRGPWVYVGTSDEPYHGDLDRVRADPAEVEEILAMTRDCFPEAGLEAGDVEATWAGLRPLVREEGKSTRDMSRRDEIWCSAEGLVTVAGGKLTTYRRMAERALEAVGSAASLEVPPSAGATRRTPLPGATGPDGEPFCPGDLEDLRAAELSALERSEVRGETLERLRWLYGCALTRLRALGEEDADWLRPLAPGLPALRAEVRYAVEEEMAVTLEDFMDRRAALLLFAPRHGLEGAEEASRIMASLLQWSEEHRQREVARYRTLAAEHDYPP